MVIFILIDFKELDKNLYDFYSSYLNTLKDMTVDEFLDRIQQTSLELYAVLLAEEIEIEKTS